MAGMVRQAHHGQSPGYLLVFVYHSSQNLNPKTIGLNQTQEYPASVPIGLPHMTYRFQAHL